MSTKVHTWVAVVLAFSLGVACAFAASAGTGRLEAPLKMHFVVTSGYERHDVEFSISYELNPGTYYSEWYQSWHCYPDLRLSICNNTDQVVVINEVGVVDDVPDSTIAWEKQTTNYYVNPGGYASVHIDCETCPDHELDYDGTLYVEYTVGLAEKNTMFLPLVFKNY